MRNFLGLHKLIRRYDDLI